jgi:AraC-like DNA-binding protein
VDLLAALFDDPRREPPFLLRTQMRPPFRIELRDRAPLCLVVAARGSVAIRLGDEVAELPEHSTVLVRGERPWSVADRVDSDVTAVIHPGQRCETVAGEPVAERWSRGVRTWGNTSDVDAAHVMLTGTYERMSERGRLLLDALPDVLVAPEGSIDPSLLSLFAGEVVRDDIAQPVVLERMLDLIVVLAVRHWLRHAETLPPGVVRGSSDPTVGSAIRLMQADPAERWTVQSLARRVGVSRATFAKRFHELVGTTPIAFLTDWRLSLGADLLTSTDSSIAAIATEVGYGSAFAFSTAFKRRYGVSPHRFRSGGTSDAEGGSALELEHPGVARELRGHPEPLRRLGAHAVGIVGHGDDRVRHRSRRPPPLGPRRGGDVRDDVALDGARTGPGHDRAVRASTSGRSRRRRIRRTSSTSPPRSHGSSSRGDRGPDHVDRLLEVILGGLLSTSPTSTS